MSIVSANAVTRLLLQLEPRRQLLAAGVAAGVLLALVAMSLVALHNRHAAAQRDFHAAEVALNEVQALAAQWQALQSQGGAAATADLASLVNRSLQSYGLQPSRLQQNSADELQLRLDSVAFADAVAWLAALEELPGVVVVRASFSQGPNGSTSLSLSLRRA